MFSRILFLVFLGWSSCLGNETDKTAELTSSFNENNPEFIQNVLRITETLELAKDDEFLLKKLEKDAEAGRLSEKAFKVAKQIASLDEDYQAWSPALIKKKNPDDKKNNKKSPRGPILARLMYDWKPRGNYGAHQGLIQKKVMKANEAKAFGLFVAKRVTKNLRTEQATGIQNKIINLVSRIKDRHAVLSMLREFERRQAEKEYAQNKKRQMMAMFGGLCGAIVALCFILIVSAVRRVRRLRSEDPPSLRTTSSTDSLDKPVAIQIITA